jgi:hypothetical protein
MAINTTFPNLMQQNSMSPGANTGRYYTGLASQGQQQGTMAGFLGNGGGFVPGTQSNTPNATAVGGEYASPYIQGQGGASAAGGEPVFPRGQPTPAMQPEQAMTPASPMLPMQTMGTSNIAHIQSKATEVPNLQVQTTPQPTQTNTQPVQSPLIGQTAGQFGNATYQNSSNPMVQQFIQQFGNSPFNNEIPDSGNTSSAGHYLTGRGIPQYRNNPINEGWASDPSRVMYFDASGKPVSQPDPNGSYVMEAGNLNGDKIAAMQSRDARTDQRHGWQGALRTVGAIGAGLTGAYGLGAFGGAGEGLLGATGGLAPEEAMGLTNAGLTGGASGTAGSLSSYAGMTTGLDGEIANSIAPIAQSAGTSTAAATSAIQQGVAQGLKGNALSTFLSSTLGISPEAANALTSAGGSILSGIVQGSAANNYANNLGNAANRADPLSSANRATANDLFQQYLQNPFGFISQSGIYRQGLDQLTRQNTNRAAATGYLRSQNPNFDFANALPGLLQQSVNAVIGPIAQAAGVNQPTAPAGNIMANGAQNMTNMRQASINSFIQAGGSVLDWLNKL